MVLTVEHGMTTWGGHLKFFYGIGCTKTTAFESNNPMHDNIYLVLECEPTNCVTYNHQHTIITWIRSWNLKPHKPKILKPKILSQHARKNPYINQQRNQQ
jgi:hypothetical protein